MAAEKEHEYTPIDLDEDDLRPARHSKPRISTWRLLLYLEIAHVFLFALVYTVWHLSHRGPHHCGSHRRDRPCEVSTEDLRLTQMQSVLNLPLSRNVTKVFTVDKDDLRLALNTDAANYYWLNITRDLRNGLVSLPEKLTKNSGLEGSGLNTTVGESVFQVDMFHQLHCLVR